MLTEKPTYSAPKRANEMECFTKNEFIKTDEKFDLQEIEMALLMERKQNEDYHFYYQLSLFGFYLSLILFFWQVLVEG